MSEVYRNIIGVASICIGMIVLWFTVSRYITCRMGKTIPGFDPKRYEGELWLCPEPQAPPRHDFLFALKGDVIVCDGREAHEIGEFLCDVEMGEMPRPEHMGLWRQDIPIWGQKIEHCRCSICDAPWAAHVGHLRFKDGWR